MRSFHISQLQYVSYRSGRETSPRFFDPAEAFPVGKKECLPPSMMHMYNNTQPRLLIEYPVRFLWYILIKDLASAHR